MKNCTCCSWQASKRSCLQLAGGMHGWTVPSSLPRGQLLLPSPARVSGSASDLHRLANPAENLDKLSNLNQESATVSPYYILIRRSLRRHTQMILKNPDRGDLRRLVRVYSEPFYTIGIAYGRSDRRGKKLTTVNQLINT